LLRQARVSLLLAVAALVSAFAAYGYLLFANVYTGKECVAGIGEPLNCTTTKHTMAEENGIGVLAWLLIPTLLPAVVVLMDHRSARIARVAAWAAVVLLCSFCLVTGFSVGLLYFPAAVLCLLSVLRREVVGAKAGSSSTSRGK